MALFGFGRKKVDLLAPFEGQIVGLDDVPDPVFSGRMLGEGFAVVPDDDAATCEVVAPCAGKLMKVFKTGHAFALVSDEGLEVLVHIGLETVEMKGEGFEALAATGDHVEAGQPVIRVDLTKVRAAGRNPITPVVCTNAKQVAELAITGSAEQAATVTLN